LGGGKRKKRKQNDHWAKLIMAGPTSAWMLLFVALPILYVLAVSFMRRGEYGGIVLGFTLEHFLEAFTPIYLMIFLRSMMIAAETTLACVLIAYPFAYYIAQKKTVARTILYSMVMIPFMISSLIRLFSWINLLRRDGIINTLLLNLDIIPAPLQLVYNEFGVTLGLIYTLLPFMILPLYSSIGKLDPTLAEAAQDLGGRPVKIFFTITLPLTAPGVFAGSLMVFIPSLGIFFVTDLLGGNKTQVLGNIIRDQYLTAHNWPLGSAISILLILVTLIMVWLYQKMGGEMDKLGGV
jgi:spermidine/putrescine transport system permease protein